MAGPNEAWGLDVVKPLHKNTASKKYSLDTRAELFDLALLSEFEIKVACLEPDELIQRALGFLSEQLDSARCSIALREQKGDGVVVYATAGDDKAAAPGQGIPAGHSAPSEVLGTRQPLYRPDIASADKVFALDAVLLESGILSDYITPLIQGEQVLGTLNLGATTLDGISPRVQKFTQRLAPRLAVALNSALLYQQLQRSEARLKGYLLHAPVGVFVADEQGRHIEANPAACELVGYSRDELLNINVSEIATEVSPQELAEVISRISSGERFSMETRVRHKDGSLVDVRLYGATAGQGQLIAHVIDLREQRQAERQRQEAERQVMQSQKLESLGVLAGGIAHDFNNLLTSILGHADLALLDADPATELHASLGEILQTARRAADLSSQMLAYSGKGHFVIEPVELNALIESMLPLLGVAISKRHHLDLQLFSTPLTVEADAAQLRQVLMNLVLNASEAMSRAGGHIELSTRPVRREAWTSRYIHTGQLLPAGSYAEIAVHDQGEGMSAETRDRLFEPFFSTKFTGRGLGLATVHGIVRGHKGDIEVDSEPGRQSTLRVLLPLIDAGQAEASPESGQPKPMERGAWFVLVVDDEQVVRFTTQRMLQRLGCRVEVAPSGESALDLLAQARALPDLALVDLTMPGISGIQCARHIRERWPQVRVLISSGVSRQDLDDRLDAGESFSFIHKPFSMEELGLAVQKVMRGSTAQDDDGIGRCSKKLVTDAGS